MQRSTRTACLALTLETLVLTVSNKETLEQPDFPAQKRLLFASQRVCELPPSGAVPKWYSSDNARSR